MRIGQPLGINSRLKVLGKVRKIYVNFERELLNSDPTKSELNDPNAPNDFKEFKAKQRSRDHSMVSLDNSKDEDDSF